MHDNWLTSPAAIRFMRLSSRRLIGKGPVGGVGEREWEWRSTWLLDAMNVVVPLKGETRRQTRNDFQVKCNSYNSLPQVHPYILTYHACTHTVMYALTIRNWTQPRSLPPLNTWQSDTIIYPNGSNAVCQKNRDYWVLSFDFQHGR